MTQSSSTICAFRGRDASVFAMMLACSVMACTERRSELAVVYRGDVASERAMVRVRIDSGDRVRVIAPAFPSIAHPEAVRTRGDLPIDVTLLAPSGDTVARYAPPAIRLSPRTAYTVGIVVGRRPAGNLCTGPWAGTAITGRAESLYVSVSITERATEPPRCDD